MSRATVAARRTSNVRRKIRSPASTSGTDRCETAIVYGIALLGVEPRCSIWPARLLSERQPGGAAAGIMKLKIETFSNIKGGNSFYKAVTHPLAARAVPQLIARIGSRKLALYDPQGAADGFAEFYGVSELRLDGSYVQDVAAIGKPVLGRAAQPVTEIGESGAEVILVAAFDADRLVAHIRHLLPRHAEVLCLDALRLPDELVTNRSHYLDP